jgi:hypothetical protein
MALRLWRIVCARGRRVRTKATPRLRIARRDPSPVSFLGREVLGETATSSWSGEARTRSLHREPLTLRGCSTESLQAERRTAAVQKTGALSRIGNLRRQTDDIDEGPV